MVGPLFSDIPIEWPVYVKQGCWFSEAAVEAFVASCCFKAGKTKTDQGEHNARVKSSMFQYRPLTLLLLFLVSRCGLSSVNTNIPYHYF